MKHIKNNSLLIRERREPLGFSLVEVLVIVAILGILTGLSGMALFKWLPEANLKRAVRTVVSMGQTARIEAIKRNSRINFNCTTDICTIQLPDNTQLRRFDLSSIRGVQVTNNMHTTYNSRGRSLIPGSLTIVNDAGKSYTITFRSSGSIVTN